MATKTKQQSTNTYQYMPAPITPQVTEAETVSKNLKGQIDPRIRSTFAGARQNLQDSFLNPLGAYTTPAIRDATLRAGNADLAQKEAQALTEAGFEGGSMDFSRALALAELTKAPLVQTGGTSTTTQSGLGNILGGIIGGAAQIGSAAIM